MFYGTTGGRGAKKPYRRTIPTPSLSCPFSRSASPTCKSNCDINTDPISGMPSPRKRTRENSDENTAHDSDEASYEETPKARRSTPSTSSITSGASSPTKQFRYAAKQDTGFQPLNFEPHLHSLPQPLRTLQALLPLELQQEVQELGDFPGFAFYDPTTSKKQWRIPSTDFVQNIVKHAAECDQDCEGESSWNIDVHSRLLDFGFRQRSSSLVDFRCCKHPIALSVETKRQAEWDWALLQIGTWHSSQWRALQRESDADVAGIGCLPGIITVEGGKAKLYHKLDIGGTDSHFRVYKLVVALQYLGEWIEEVYWPAFKQTVLSMAPTT
ncbi:hypothetical protein EDB81DRAFT_869910 [Dactylonectria macrodidyma]|uniref:PD-(D/E)XK nuclease-like domain-containing protein n=1 Tax=Dactylonectria macrodidyma TaxID=307937 RepID=A0A9P9J1P5_9HYPO|nr:hypothetical protein EDB81DRAFT_869910 [Dactylonectria macrodidyma]